MLFFIRRLPAYVLTLSGLAAFLCLSVAAGAFAQPGEAPPAQGDGPTSLEKTNQEFRTFYAQAKKEIQDKLGPVIVAVDDKLVLLNFGQRQEAQIIPSLYTAMKTVDHVPLALFLFLNSRANQKLSAAEIEIVNHFHELTEDAEKRLPSAGFSPEKLNRQYRILDRSLALMERTSSNSVIGGHRLLVFAKELRPSIEANVYDAASLELEAIDLHVSKWRHEMPPAQWNRLHVVVIGKHMPRQQNCTMQYFQKLLNQEQEGDKVIYMEGGGDEQGALDLLSTHILDASIAEEFFGSHWRMHRDLLSDSARRYLDEHPPSR